MLSLAGSVATIPVQALYGVVSLGFYSWILALAVVDAERRRSQRLSHDDELNHRSF